MKFRDFFRYEKRNMCSKNAVAAMCIGLVFAFFTVIACGNLYVYSFLMLPRHAPPPFFFFLFFFLLVCAHSISAGILYRFRTDRKCGSLPLVFDLLALLFVILWYVAFFKTLSFVFSLLLLLFALFLDFCTVREIIKSGMPGSLPLCGGAVIGLVMLWINISVILLN